MIRPAWESGGFCEAPRRAIDVFRGRDLIEAGLNEAAAGFARQGLWGLYLAFGQLTYVSFWSYMIATAEAIMSKPISIQEFMQMFPDDGACLEHLFTLRYGAG